VMRCSGSTGSGSTGMDRLLTAGVVNRRLSHPGEQSATA
jgi:hypothetical protein